MKNILKALSLIFVLSVVCLAQTVADDEYKKNEYYVGYSNQQSDDFGNRTSHGGEFSYTRNVSRYIGIKGDFSAAFQKYTFRGTYLDQNGNNVDYDFENRNARYTFLGGIQIKDNASKARFKPFAHVLAGVAVNRTKFAAPILTCANLNCTPVSVRNVTSTQTDFSAALGGGLDIKINDRVDFRAFQVDYNPTYDSGRFRNNVRIGVGFVFK